MTHALRGRERGPTRAGPRGLSRREQARIVLGPAGTLLNFFKVAVGNPIGLRLYASAREKGFALADRPLHARDLGRYVRYGSGSISRKKDLDAPAPVGNFREMVPPGRHFIVPERGRVFKGIENVLFRQGWMRDIPVNLGAQQPGESPQTLVTYYLLPSVPARFTLNVTQDFPAIRVNPEHPGRIRKIH